MSCHCVNIWKFRGSVMFLIKTSSGKCYLHTGDYRYSPEMVQTPCLLQQWIDIVYMDVTFCHPSHQFPTKRQSANNLADFIKSKRKDKKWKKTHNLCLDIVYIAARMLGVETFLVELCTIFETKIWVDPRGWKYKHFSLFPSTAPYVTC